MKRAIATYLLGYVAVLSLLTATLVLVADFSVLKALGLSMLGIALFEASLIYVAATSFLRDNVKRGVDARFGE
jgi:hypothetical protein